MEFDDLFENKNRRQQNFREHAHPNDHHYSQQSNHGHHDHINWLNILNKIRSNPKLKIILLLAGVIIIIILIFIVMFLFPLIAKLYNYVAQNGIQGLVDGITTFLDKIWKGTGKG